MDINPYEYRKKLEKHREKLGVPDLSQWGYPYHIAKAHPVALRICKGRVERSLSYSHFTDRWFASQYGEIRLLNTLGEYRIVGHDLDELWEALCFEACSYMQEQPIMVNPPWNFSTEVAIHRQSLGNPPAFRNSELPYWEAARPPLMLRIRKKNGIERALSWSHLKDLWFDADEMKIRMHFTLGIVEIKGIALAELYEAMSRQTVMFIQELDEALVQPLPGIPFITSLTWPEKRKHVVFNPVTNQTKFGAPTIDVIDWPTEITPLQ